MTPRLLCYYTCFILEYYCLLTASACPRRSECSFLPVDMKMRTCVKQRLGATYVHVVETLVDLTKSTLVSDILIDLHLTCKVI